MSKNLEKPYSDWYIGFWLRFEELCEQYRTTPQNVGERIGLSPATISQWKKTYSRFVEIVTLEEWEIDSGGTMPSVESLIKLSRYFNCTTDYLIGLNETPENYNRTIERLSEENQVKVKEYIELLALKQKQDDEKGQ